MPIVLDYTARIPPAALKAAGVSGVCRYLKPDSAPAYRIGLAEYRELLAAGIDVTLNWEFDTYDWRGGASVGGAHGTLAAAEARALGYPGGSVIIGSADFDVSRAGWLAYGRGYATAFAANVRRGGYRPGVYGPWDVLHWVAEERLMDAFWQAGMSTSWSGGRNRNPWPGAHLRQRGHKTVAGQDVDWNEILIPNWGNPNGPTPAQLEDDMTPEQDARLKRIDDRLTTVMYNAATNQWGEGGEKNALHDKLETLTAPAPVALSDAQFADLKSAIVAAVGEPLTIEDVNAAVDAKIRAVLNSTRLTTSTA